MPADINYQEKSEEKKESSTQSTKVIMRKKSVGSKLHDSFIKEDINVVKDNLVENVIIPGIIDIIFDTFSRGLEMVLYGDSASSSSRRRRTLGGGTNYNKISFESNNRSNRRVVQSSGISKYEPNEIIVGSRPVAEEILEKCRDYISDYKELAISDFYDIVYEVCKDDSLKLSTTYIDQKWGWKDLDDAGVRRIHEGYLLVMPPAISISK